MMAVQLHTDFRCAIWSGVNVLISGGNADARLRAAQRIHEYTHPRGARFLVIASDRAREQICRLRSLCRARVEGTVFVDEVSRLDPDVQTSLLKLLRSRVARAVRIVTGTSVDLFDLVKRS